MVKKLRFKFVLYSMVSIFSLLLILLLSLNISNFIIVSNDADIITENIVQNNGSFLASGQQQNQQTNQGNTPPNNQGGSTSTNQGNTPPNNQGNNQPPSISGINSPEAQASTRYVTARYNIVNDSYEVTLDNNSRFTQASEVIEIVKGLNREVGWYSNYRYRVHNVDLNTKLYVLLDYGRELTPTYNTLYISIGVLVGGSIVSFVALFFISKLVVKPLIDNQHRQKRFISDASHELKTPITIISANNEIEELEKGQSDATVAISNQIIRLTNLVKNLNTLVKYDETPKIKKNEFDIVNSITEIAEGFIKTFEAKNKKLELDIIKTDMIYNGDEAQIRELCSIILDNALKYSKTYAKFTLNKELNRVIIRCENDTDNEYPERYNGELNVVFDRFYRGENERAAETSGSGIGLSIAKEIVNAHGGRVYANGKKNIFIIKAEI